MRVERLMTKAVQSCRRQRFARACGTPSCGAMTVDASPFALLTESAAWWALRRADARASTCSDSTPKQIGNDEQ
jgi:hypothetical protein